jgi:hypothetical protein
MSIIAQITEGWKTTMGPFTLKADGVAINLTGTTVRLRMRDGNNVVYPDTGTVVIDAAPSSGKVTYQPSGTEFVANGAQSRTLSVHFEVTDGTGHVVYVPNGQPDTLLVWPK